MTSVHFLLVSTLFSNLDHEATQTHTHTHTHEPKGGVAGLYLKINLATMAKGPPVSSSKCPMHLSQPHLT